MTAARLVLAIAGAAMLTVAGCSSWREKPPQLMNLRSSTSGPDEFAIVPPKALELPEDLALLPEPTPGGENRTDPRPKDDAVVALGGTPRSASPAVPAADGALLAHAGRAGVSSDIRLALAEPGDSVKQLVLNLGKEISKSAPSTFGTLYASGFLAAGLAINDGDDPLTQLRAGLQAALDKIALRGKSAEGQRTLLDALGPATRAAHAASDMASALSAAAEKSGEGVEATKGMDPQHGRAGWIGERAKGLADAGATVIWRSFQAISN